VADDSLLDRFFAGRLTLAEFLALRGSEARAQAVESARAVRAFCAQLAPWRRGEVEPPNDLGLLKKAHAEGRLSLDSLRVVLTQDLRASRTGTFRRLEIEAELAQLARAYAPRA
jgi:hypothetical protein